MVLDGNLLEVVEARRMCGDPGQLAQYVFGLRVVLGQQLAGGAIDGEDGDAEEVEHVAVHGLRSELGDDCFVCTDEQDGGCALLLDKSEPLEDLTAMLVRRDLVLIVRNKDGTWEAVENAYFSHIP